MKSKILYTLIFVGIIVGVLAIINGMKKHSACKSNFRFTEFFVKSWRNTDFNEFSGIEVITIGILVICVSLLMLYFYRDLLPVA